MLIYYILFMKTLKEEMEDLNQFEKEKLCNLLQCNDSELEKLFENAGSVLGDTNTIYEVLLKILQQGNNVREAALSGIICGKIIGHMEAKDKIEFDIKEKLFNAFKNNI